MNKKSTHNPPRPYDLDDPAELLRLYRETRGYIRTCEMMGHGTDLEGRRYAQDALRRLINRAIGAPEDSPMTDFRRRAETAASEADRIAWLDAAEAVGERDHYRAKLAEHGKLCNYVDPARALKRYPEALHLAREAARPLGYAIGVHGSEARDLDLIAVPWADVAATPVELAEAIRVAVGGVYHDREDTPYGHEGRPSAKPHGRLVWSFHLGGGPYIDLSVYPSGEQRADRLVRALADIHELTGQRDAARADSARLKRCLSQQQHAIQQELGKALGYAKFSDHPDAFPGAYDDEVCVGDHVAESLAAEAGATIAALRERAEAAERERDAIIKLFVYEMSEPYDLYRWVYMAPVNRSGLATKHRFRTEADAVAAIRQAAGLTPIAEPHKGNG